MDLYDALNQMRELSRKKIPFSFTFMSYNRTAQKTHGIVEVHNGRLVNRSKLVKYENDEYIEPYYDLDQLENKKFYQCTLMSFNGHQIKLT